MSAENWLCVRNAAFLSDASPSGMEHGDLCVDGAGMLTVHAPGSGPASSQELDGSALLAMPGMVNGHTHVFDCGCKESWIGHSISKLFSPNGIKNTMLGQQSDADLRASATQAFREMAARGVTCTAVFVEQGLRGLQACVEARRSSPTLSALLLGRPLTTDPTEEELRALLELGDGIALGSSNGFSDDALRLVRTLCTESGKLLAAHIAEDKPSPNVVRACEVFRPDFLVHGNYFSVDERKRLVEAGIGLVCCIRSGSAFGIETVDLVECEAVGLKFAFGTDNMMSNSPGMFREMEFVARDLLRRNGGVLPAGLDAARLLRATAADAHAILKQPHRGAIASGMRADFLLLRKDTELTPFHGASSILFRADERLLRWIVNGTSAVRAALDPDDPLKLVPLAAPMASKESLVGSPVSEAVAAFARGEMVLVADSEDRENEGDLIVAAELATEEQIAFIVKWCTGIVCVAMAGEDCDRLELPLMVSEAKNTDAHGTAFCVTCDASEALGVTTGVSAADRMRTCRALAAGTTVPTDLKRPGHIFPLRARAGGVLARSGHTEAAVDLCRAAGLRPAGVICEMVASKNGQMATDGSMARRDHMREFAAEHKIQMIQIQGAGGLEEFMAAGLAASE